MYILIAFFAFLFFAYKRILLFTHFYQQKSYDTKLFIKFIFKNFQLIDKKLSFIIFFYTIFATGTKIYLLDIAVLTLLFIGFGVLTPSPTSNYFKDRLDFTPRTKSLIGLSSIITFLISSIFFLYTYNLYDDGIYCLCSVMGYLIFMIQSLPFNLIIANILLFPVEMYFKRKRIKKAKEKLKKISPIVIGITGSFGKTSTKNILNHILSSKASSYTTPKSVNTIIGLSDMILKDLKPSHKYFIAEIGTSRKGRVKRICDLVEPKHAILTSIGFAHIEFFKTQEGIAKEKFNLIKSSKKQGGFYVINPHLVDKKFIKMHDAKETKFETKDVKLQENGLNFKLIFDKKTYDIFAPVFGCHQAENISLAFIMALNFGFQAKDIIKSLETLPQTKHRLELKEGENGTFVIDDTYNSNISGFKSAIETLGILAGFKKGRAILVASGMAEIGAEHDKQHAEVAKKALDICDIAIAVIPERIKSFADTFEKGKNSKQQLILANTLKDANEWLEENAKPGDVILYENDMHDVYETKIKI